MSASDVWMRLVNSGVADLSAVADLRLSSEKSASAGEAATSDERVLNWLVENGKLTDYQRRILIAGHDGPFRYGDYLVTSRAEPGPFPDSFHAVHLPTEHPVLLVFVGGDDVVAANQWKAWKQLASRWNRFENGFVHEIHEAVAFEAWRFVVLPWFRGKTLREKVPAGGRVPWVQTAQSLEHLAMAVQAIHKKGLVHGRIAPSYIWVQKGAVCQLLPPLNVPAGIVDESVTGDYSSPRQRSAQHPATPGDDLFALGQVALRLLTGSSISLTATNAKDRAAELEPLLLKLAARELQLAMKELIRGLLDADISSAPINADAAIALLRTALEGQSTAADLDRGPKTRTAWRNHLSAASEKLAAPVAGDSAKASNPFESGRSEGLGDIRSRLPAQLDLGQIQASLGDTRLSPAGIRNRARKPASRLPLAISAGIFFASVAIGLMLTRFGSKSDEVAKESGDVVREADNATDPGETENSTSSEKTDGDRATGSGQHSPAASEWFRQSVVNGNQELAWESPTAGAPLDLSRIPPSPDLVVVWRPSSLFSANGEGEKLCRALGPGFEKLKTSWESATGIPLKEVATMTISLHPESGKHNVFVQADLDIAKDRETLPLNGEQWKPAPSPVADVALYNNDDWQAGLVRDPADERNVTEVFLASGSLLDTLQPGGKEARCDPAMRELIARSDSSRHATLLLMNSALASEEGDRLFQGDYAGFRRPLSFFFSEHVRAVSLSLHFDAGSYLELMTSQTLDLKAKDAAEHLQQKLAGLASLVAPATGGSASPHWGPLQLRFAKMVEEVVRNTRVAAEGEGVIANCWLPSSAIHNLVAGAELAMAVGPGTVETVALAEMPASLDQLLQTRRTLRITNSPDLRLLLEDFQNEVRGDFSELPFEFNIRLMGDDLQVDGITQNQRPGNLDLVDKSIAEILTEIMLKANPDKNATGTRDEKCKLLWVVADDPESPGNQAVLVTTRNAAATKGYDLPAAFRLESRTNGN